MTSVEKPSSTAVSTTASNEKPAKKAKSKSNKGIGISKLPDITLKRTGESQVDVFANAVIQKGVTSLALSLDFGIAEGAALNGLTSLVKNKIHSLGTKLKTTAEASNRKLVTLEDFAACVPAVKEVLTVPSEPFKQVTGVPSFPFEPQQPPKKPSDANAMVVEEDVRRIAGLGHHFPALPAEHTYKRSKLEEPELSTAEIAELRRTQQRQSVLVRESLAQMREGSNHANDGDSSTH